MKAREAAFVLKMIPPDTEVELIFPDAREVKPVHKPVKPLTEGEMASLPMHPDKAQDWNQNPSYKQFEWEGHP